MQNGGCDIYQSRPIQCRTYPFWKTALTSRRDFIDATSDCPGTHLDSDDLSVKYNVNKIEEISALNGEIKILDEEIEEEKLEKERVETGLAGILPWFFGILLGL